MARLFGRLCLGLLGTAAAGGAGLLDREDAVTPSQILAESRGIKWSSCGDASVSALFGLHDASFDAQALQVAARGVLNKELTGGNVTMGLVLGKAPSDASMWERTKRRMGFALKKQSSTEDLCVQRRRAGLHCRVAPGLQELRFGLSSLPTTVVAGEIKMRVKAFNQEGKQFLCLQGSLDIKRSARGGLFRTLTAAAPIDAPYGPCFHGSKWDGTATAGEICNANLEWDKKVGATMTQASCVAKGGRWDQANFDADGNGCKFDSEAKCLAAGFTYTKLGCQQEFEGKEQQFKELAMGRNCQDVKTGGRPMQGFVSSLAGTCCGDRKSVCDLSGKPYAWRSPKQGPAPVGVVAVASGTERAQPVAMGLLGITVVSALL